MQRGLRCQHQSPQRSLSGLSWLASVERTWSVETTNWIPNLSEFYNAFHALAPLSFPIFLFFFCAANNVWFFNKSFNQTELKSFIQQLCIGDLLCAYSWGPTMLLHCSGNWSSESKEANHIIPTLLELIVQMRGTQTRSQKNVTTACGQLLWRKWTSCWDGESLGEAFI